MSKKGFQAVQNNTIHQGDLLIEIKVKLPILSDEQIKALHNIIQPKEHIDIKV